MAGQPPCQPLCQPLCQPVLWVWHGRLWLVVTERVSHAAARSHGRQHSQLCLQPGHCWGWWPPGSGGDPGGARVRLWGVAASLGAVSTRDVFLALVTFGGKGECESADLSLIVHPWLAVEPWGTR